MADHLAHSEALLSVQLGDQVVEITERQGPDAWIIVGRLAREPNCG
jgi:hypothetical protein